MSDVTRRRTDRRVLAAALVLLALVASVLVASAGAGSRASTAASARASARTDSFGRLVLRFARDAARPAPVQAFQSPIGLRGLQAAAGTPCGETGVQCSHVVVPLDRTGVVPGTISLLVQVLPAFGPEKGVMFLIAGGPGQGSAHVFGLDNARAVNLYRQMFPGYTLVAFDNRGTGSSGLFDCPVLQGDIPLESEADEAAACADTIGPQRAFYGTPDHAEDLEAVRQALGVDRVGLWGTSYGTKLALAYALAHPDHVERLLLDSVLPTDLPDPLNANVTAAMPAALTAFCSDGSCRAATPDFAGDVAVVANRLAAAPVAGKVLRVRGRAKTVKMTGIDLLGLVVDSDLSPGLAAELPAAVHAARSGDVRALLRLFDLNSVGSAVPSEELSFALYAATDCRDGPFPWQQDTPVADRQAFYDAAIAALPAGSFGPFGTWAAASGNAHFCIKWPSPSGGAVYGPGPLPNVPVLAVDGGYDMRTPSASAAAVASQFPQGKLLVVPAVGHNVLGADPSFCAVDAVRSWILGGPVPTACARPKPFVPTLAALPPALKPARPAGARRTLDLVSRTIREAEAIWILALSAPGDAVAGLTSGQVVATGSRSFKLVRYGIAPGVQLTGSLRLAKLGLPLDFEGVISVGGPSAAHGILTLSGERLGGTLGGQIVRG